jgi:hypothetical protein
MNQHIDDFLRKFLLEAGLDVEAESDEQQDQPYKFYELLEVVEAEGDIYKP